MLRDAGFSVHLSHPSGNDWGNRRVKNDERDVRERGLEDRHHRQPAVEGIADDRVGAHVVAGARERAAGVDGLRFAELVAREEKV